MTVAQNIILSIVCSLAASFIFLFSILFLFKPKIRISSFMCRGKIPGDEANYFYFIKIVNKSIFSAYDINAQIYKIERYPTPPVGMINNRITPLSLVLNNLSHLAPYRPKWLRKEAEHAYRLRSTDNLNAIIDNDLQLVRIEVSAKHGLTGLTKVFIEEYSHSSQIKIGTFTYGTKFDFMN